MFRCQSSDHESHLYQITPGDPQRHCKVRISPKLKAKCGNCDTVLEQNNKIDRAILGNTLTASSLLRRFDTAVLLALNKGW